MKNPYEPVSIDGFKLPNGALALMSDVVLATDHHRIAQEIMLIQSALGVKADGLIGPETREAIRRLAASH
jgi:lysozyme family protein